MTQEFSYLEWEGIDIPYRSSEALTILDGSGNETKREIPPAYITNLEQFLKTGSKRSARNALASMAREALLDLVRQMGFRAWGWEAPTAVSAMVPFGHVFLDKKSGRIVLNETQATLRYVDADGDRAMVLPDEKWEKCVLVKFPITSQPPILTIIQVLEPEKFQDFTKDDWILKLKAENPVIHPETHDEILEIFTKKHLDVPVGLRTSAWNNFELWKSQRLSWNEKMEYLFNSHKDALGITQRSKDIEDAGMKAARKEGRSLDEAWVIKQMHQQFAGASVTLQDEYAWALTSRSSIGSMEPDQLKWFDKADLRTLVKDILNLRVKFRKVKAGDKIKEPAPVFHEANLLHRLKNLGLVGWEEIPHASPDLPPSVIFWLQLPNGEPVALTDVKREDGRDEGLTYLFMLPPVWDNANLVDESGNPVAIETEDFVLGPARKQWVHPIEHLQKMLCTFDSCIKASNGFVVSHFPKNMADWQDPKRSVKVTMLYKWLSDYCGRYGDPCPSIRSNGNIVPTEMAKAVISHSVAIDYGRAMNHMDMWEVAKQAYSAHKFGLMGSKSTSRRIRKYMLANEKNGSCFDPQCLCSPYRGGAQRSQLQRGLKMVTMRVAITEGTTRNQCFITPSGVKKQSVDEAFMPRVFNTYDEYLQHLTDLDIKAEDEPATEVTYFSWTGELRRCWTTGARSTIRVGKLVSPDGQKFMPLSIGQAFSKAEGDKLTAEEIDLIVPIQELLDKNCAHLVMQGAEEQILFLPNGQEVKAMVLTYDYVRTGASSENIQPRYRWANFKAMDSYPIEHQLKKIREVEPRKVKPRFALELQEARHLVSMRCQELIQEREATQQREALEQEESYE